MQETILKIGHQYPSHPVIPESVPPGWYLAECGWDLAETVDEILAESVDDI